MPLGAAGGLARPWSWLAVPVAAYAILAGLMAVDPRQAVLRAPTSSTTPPSPTTTPAGREPRMRARLDAFAARHPAAEGTADEIVVIGHSSSSFLGIEVLDRVLAADPAFGTPRHAGLVRDASAA